MAILWAWCSNATTYFIDFVGGSDAANGTSSVTPWQHCPGDSLCTGNAASKTPAAGDTFIFKGGVNYLGTVAIKGNGGTPGSPIIYDGNTAGTFGTGKAIFNGQDTATFGFNAAVGFSYRSPVQTIEYSNMVFQGFQFTRYGGHGTWNPANITWTCGTLPSAVNGYAIELEACHNVFVGSCLFTNIGDWTNAPNMDAGINSGVGVRIDQYNQNIVITNCEFTQIGQAAIHIRTEHDGDWFTNITVGACNMHNYLQWGIEVTPLNNNATCNGIYITNNTIHDMWEYAANVWLGCPGNNPHMDGIFCFLGYSPSIVTGVTLGTVANPIVIANNYWYNNMSNTNQGGTASIYLSGFGGRVLIYNNVFNNVLNLGNGSVFVRQSLDPASNSDTPLDYELYNNTFYDQVFGYCVESDQQAFATTNGTVKIKNNIFNHAIVPNAAVPVAFGFDAWSKPTELDYNGYFTVRPDQDINTSWNGAQTFNTFAQLQALGFETHGFYGDPKFVNVSQGLGLTSSGNDLHIQTTSPAKGTGVNLSSLFTTDFSGNTRGTWDMGAFAFAGGTTPGMIMNLSVLRAGNTFISK